MYDYCSNCGDEYKEKSWPRHCIECANVKYQNPIPGVIVIVPVLDHDSGGLGLLLIKRKIPPMIDGIAFPGGYLDVGETCQQAASRELKEETGIIINEKNFSLFQVKELLDEDKILIFMESNVEIYTEDLNKFKENDEVSEVSVAYEPIELCFSSHTEVLKSFAPYFRGKHLS